MTGKTLPTHFADHLGHQYIAGYSRNRMQQPIAVCTRAETLIRTCPCAACIWLLHPAPTISQDGLHPLQLVLVVFPFQQLTQKHKLHSWWSLHATCTGGVFVCQLAHLPECTGTYGHVLQLHCEGVLIYIYIYICSHLVGLRQW